MQEMLEEFTQNKLNLTSEICEVRKNLKLTDEHLKNTQIENESLNRQINRLTEENDSLLRDIDCMEEKLEQVSFQKHKSIFTRSFWLKLNFLYYRLVLSVRNKKHILSF